MTSGAHSKKYKAFLKKLVQARIDSGLTQAEVGKLLNRHQSYISKCESGERRVDFVELLDFSNIYKVPLSYFEDLDD